ncbi:DNA-binding protein [Thermococcus profundus]|uniref:DNA-binding protein n=1 Tax=Thermococcus profundus TaxID=49899 RepID=A0A2Z2MF49_THEPR|nr:DUF2341 domain-containing protein [Thermococcus profundus]ASJ03305.1 DNA-binding protein [Thermococcus profundus]
MKRRGFLLNSSVIVLIVPLLLLLATYEDVSSLIVQSQSERAQVERTYDVVTFLNLEFQKAMELSGKRAVVAVVDYVSTTGNFITQKMANETIVDLIREGHSSATSGYDTERVMAKQTLRVWLSNVTKILKKQGYTIAPSVDELASETEITVAPLDAFTIVIKARIPNVTIEDTSGMVVYKGSIPSTGDYVYSTVDIRELEDPFYSAMTGGRYHRSIRACEYAFPEFNPPITVANGTGSGSGVVVGEFGTELQYNSTHIWDSDNDYITNLTVNGVRITTDAVVLNNSDIGVMVFENGGSGGGGTGGSNWCSSLDYRINLTVQNQVGVNLDDYQIPLLISADKDFTAQVLDSLFSNTQTSSESDVFRKEAAIAIYDSNCNPVPFWIEYWDPASKKALIWIRDTIPNRGRKIYSLYFGDGTPTKGDGDQVFVFFDDFEDGVWDDKWVQVEQAPTESNGELTISGGNSIEAIRTRDLNYDGSYAVRFRMRGTSSSNNKDWDSGIEVEDSTDSSPNAYWVVRFVDDTKDQENTLVVDEDSWWGSDYTTANVDRGGKPTDYHVYEAYMRDTGAWYDYNTKIYDAKFVDITDGRANHDSYDRLIDPPSLRYLYLVNDNDNSGNEGVYDFVFIRKYPDVNGEKLEDTTYFSGISISSSEVDEKPVTSSSQPAVAGAVYDLQPLLNCLRDDRYFAIEDGWSFFERLEGSHGNHDKYVLAAREMQDEMNYKPPNGYYPIGLVSFMIPYPTYDSKLFSLMNTLGFSLKNISSADYYFLPGYFKHAVVPDGYRVWGISYGNSPSLGNLENIPFFLDPTTAKEVLGTQGACQLLYGYSCG